MKPQAMTGPEIDEVWSDEIGYDASFSERTAIQRLIAARDAQWAAMIGEPVGWMRDQRALHDGIATLYPLFLLSAPEPAQGLDGSTYSPLYAIKEPTE